MTYIPYRQGYLGDRRIPVSRIKYKKLLILQTPRSLSKNDDINELKTNINYIKKI